MKTTVELPDALMVDVKVAAARRRVTLRQFVESALRDALRSTPRRRKPLALATIPGDFAPGFDVSNREKMYEWFDRHRDRD